MPTKDKFITQSEEQEIILAIQTAEKNTSGEIRVHIEANCPTQLEKRVKEVFFKLNMQKTALRNGVLIYLAANDRQFYIFGDKGIHQKVTLDFWESTKDLMQAHFKKGEFVEGLVEGILKVGEKLKAHFPYKDDDINELSDEISRG